MEKSKILISGISGFLGYHMIKTLSPYYDIVGLYNNNKPNYYKPQLIKCDISNYSDLKTVFEKNNFKGAYHIAAFSKTALCQSDPDMSYRVNVKGTENMALLCKEFSIPSIFTSTDQVFNGEKGNYIESDEPEPINIYGEHKLKAELKILENKCDMKIVRLPLIIGHCGKTGTSFLQDFLNSCKKNQPMKMFADENRSVTTAPIISRGLQWAMEADIGIVHLAGAKAYSRYDMAIKIAELFSINKDKFQKGYHREFQFKTPRPKDVSLNIDLAVSKGYNAEDCWDDLSLVLDFF